MLEKLPMMGGGTVMKVEVGAGRGVVTVTAVVGGLLVLATGLGLFVVRIRIADGFFVVVGFGTGLCVVTGTRYVGLAVVATIGFSTSDVDGTIASFGQHTPGTNKSLKQSDSLKLIKFNKSCGQLLKSSHIPSSPSGVVQAFAFGFSPAVAILVIGASGSTFGSACLTIGAILSVTFLPRTFLLIV